MHSVVPVTLIAAAFATSSVTLVLVGVAALSLLSTWIIYMRLRRYRERSERHAAVLDAASAPIIMTDLDLRVLEGNVSARERIGVMKNARRIQQLFSLLKTSEEDAAGRILEELEAQDEANFAAYVEGPDRKKEYFRGWVRPIAIAGTTRLVTMLEDVTETTNRIDQYEVFLEKLINNVPVQVTIFSPDGRYLYVSAAVAEDERFREWLIGKTDFDYCRELGLHMEIALRRRAHRMEAVDRREIVFFEERVETHEGERNMSWRYCPYWGEEGEITMVLGFGVETTELDRYRGEIEAAREEAQKAIRLKEALLQNVSHEIRTPLSGIIGTAQMLQGEADEMSREFLENIEANGRRLADTLNDLLDLAGLHAEKLEVKPEIVNLVEELEDAVSGLRSAADDRSIFLRLTTSGREALVLADRSALNRVLHNLIENAIKFTRDGGVVVDLSEDRRNAYIRVMDTGVGIDRSKVSELFEAFSQEDDGDDRSFEGVGVGLAVAKRLLSLMGGDIHVHSSKGTGSVFVVRLPLALQEVRSGGGPRPRILVADADPETHRIVDRLLGDLFELASARTSVEAVQVAAETACDAVIVNVRIDKSASSLEVLTALRDLYGYQARPLIALDADKRPGRRSHFLREGWDDYIGKPIEKLELLNLVHNCVGVAADAA